jgi:hypothetical protein
VKPAFGDVGRLLAELFPEPVVRVRLRRPLVAACYLLSVVVGTLVLLARYTQVPFTKTIYAEDLPVYLVEALAHPWRSVFYNYAGYEQLVPRLIGQGVSLLPLPDAAAGFAIIGSAVAAACALFVFHASSGHVHNVYLRVLLGASVLLLPVALLQIVASGVNSPWYLEMALFWALLWRPASRGGLAVAALIGFAAVSSNITAAVFVLLVILRVIALPRLREQAVSLGWLAGCLLQLPYFFHSSSMNGSRVSRLATVGQSVSFYGHAVVLPAFGWHLSWVLRHWWDRNYALILVGTVLTLMIAIILIFGTVQVRMFTGAALIFGFVFTVFAATLTWWVTINSPNPTTQPGARYTCLPIFLITAVLIVAVDRLIVSRSGVRPVTAVLATIGLIGVLCIGWVPDFRYLNYRDMAPVWAPIANQWLRTCQHDSSISYYNWDADKVRETIPCSRLHR